MFKINDKIKLITNEYQQDYGFKYGEEGEIVYISNHSILCYFENHTHGYLAVDRNEIELR